MRSAMFYVMVLVWSCYFAIVTQGQATAPKSDDSKDQIAAQVERLAPQITSDSIVGFATFKTDIAHGFKIIKGVATTQPVDIAHTAVTVTDEGTEAFHIEGTFALTKAVKGKFPTFGDAKITVKVESRWGGDELYNKLCDLIHDPIGATGKPELFLVLGAPQSKSVPLDFYFVGPLQESVEAKISEFVMLLIDKPSASWSAADREKFAESTNPWIKALADSKRPATAPSERK